MGWARWPQAENTEAIQRRRARARAWKRTWEAMPPEEGGLWLLKAWLHAIFVLALHGAWAGWLAIWAARVLRRRSARGRALVEEIPMSSLIWLAAAQVGLWEYQRRGLLEIRRLLEAYGPHDDRTISNHPG
jgi:hypothetical protein